MTQRKSDTLEGYKYVEVMSRNQRAADFLAWAADRAPHEFIPYNVVVRHINGYGYTPRLNSDEVEGLRKRMGGVRNILLRKYKRGMVSLPKVGVRATVDDADMVQTEVAKKSSRVQSSVVSLERSVQVVDVASESFVAMDSSWKDWFKKNAKDVVKQMHTNDYLTRLLPPGSKKLALLKDKEK